MALRKLPVVLRDELKGILRLYHFCSKHVPDARTYTCQRYHNLLKYSLVNKKYERVILCRHLATSLTLKHSVILSKTNVLISEGRFDRHFSDKSPESDEFVEKLFKNITDGDRGSLARGITLIESTHPKKKDQAQKLLSRILKKKIQFEKDFHAHTLHDSYAFRIGKHI